MYVYSDKRQKLVVWGVLGLCEREKNIRYSIHLCQSNYTYTTRDLFSPFFDFPFSRDYSQAVKRFIKLKSKIKDRNQTPKAFGTFSLITTFILEILSQFYCIKFSFIHKTKNKGSRDL